MDRAKNWLLHERKKLSIRGLANHLGVDPMAIYHYFEIKAALLEAVTISIMKGIYKPGGENNWQLELTLLCRSYVSLLRDHPGLLETLLPMGDASFGPTNVFGSRFDQAVADLALEKRSRNAALSILADDLHGFALALHCAADKSVLDISGMEESLDFYLRALSLERPEGMPLETPA